jgi:hypothetical protein
VKRRRKTRRGRRRGHSTRRGFLGSGALGGVLSRENLAAVGGASAALMFGPMIANKLPASLGTSAGGRVAAAAIVGGIGYLALKRVNRTAAIGFLAAAVAPSIAAELGKKIGVSGYGEPDGVNYLGGGNAYDALPSPYEDAGVGEFTEESIEV